MLPITQNILCVLKDKKIVRLKKNNEKLFKKVFEDLKNLDNENIKVLSSNDEIVLMFEPKINTFLV